MSEDPAVLAYQMPAAESAQGMDVSSYQPVLTSTYGYSFIFVKATEGMTWKDPNFAANWAFLGEEVKAGRLTARGAYHFFHPSIGADVQAQFFLDVVTEAGLVVGDVLMDDMEILSGEDGTLMLSRDAHSHELHTGLRGEAIIVSGASDYAPESANGPLVPMEASAVDLANKAFLDAVASGAAAHLSGHQPRVINYSDLSVAAALPSCTGYPLFVAYYSDDAPASVSPWQTWTFWQWSAGGAPDGGDRDAYNGDVEALRAWVTPDGIEVPDVLGMRVVAEAEPALARLGLTCKINPAVNPDFIDVVDSQTPGPGTVVAPGSNVDLHIHSVTTVPDVVGKRVAAQAGPAIEKAGLTWTASPEVNPDYENIVDSQEPGGGAEAMVGSNVSLHIHALSSGVPG